MKIIGIICEYNPFHHGHIYHINKIKELYPNSLIVLVLNGYFLERGEISILTKEDKTKIALFYGIDLVLELPFIYGVQSADIFAEYSLKILNNFGVDTLVFGSECNDVLKLKNLALKQLNNQEYELKVKEYLDKGENYPTALAKALEIGDFSFLPNDLLGISYIKTILKNDYNIEPISIKRTNEYKDLESSEKIISASNIREKIKKKIDISNFVPTISKEKILNINYKRLFLLLKEKIITDSDLSIYLDVNEGIEYRLKKMIITCDNWDDFVKKVKTKRYTYNRINRMLLHILIGLKKSDAPQLNDYVKILGFNKKGQSYLKEKKDTFNIPVGVNKKSLIYQYEIKAAIIYDLINDTNTYAFEQSKQPIVVD